MHLVIIHRHNHHHHHYHHHHLMRSCFQHIHHSLLRNERIWKLLLAKAVEENGKIMMEVELLDLNLPRETIDNSTMIYLNWEIASLVIPANEEDVMNE